MRIVTKIVVYVVLVLAIWSCEEQEKATYYYPSSFYRGIELQLSDNIKKPYQAEHQRDSQNVTIGWHPYFLEEEIDNYDFSLLSTVIFYGYEWTNDPSESDQVEKVIDTWYDTDLVEKAHEDGCKVLFSVSNYGALKSKDFFESKALQQDFIDEVLVYLKMKDADGIELDFPAVLNSNRDDLTQFIKDLSFSLKRYNSNADLYVTLPFVDKNNAYAIKAIQPYVTLFVIGGNNNANFNYGKLDNEPIAPIQNPYDDKKGIAFSYKHYTGKGIEPFKVVLELPYYTTIKNQSALTIDNKVEIDSLFTEELKRMKDIPQEVKDSLLVEKRRLKVDSVEYYNDFLTYQQFQQDYGTQNIFYDKIAMSSYINIPNSNGSGDIRIYFDDSTSLGAKYDWALDNGFRGVGIWSLGYDNGYHELWRMLDSRTHKRPSTNAVNAPFSTGSYFARNHQLFRVCFTLIIVLVFLSVFMAMLHWKSRDSLTSLHTFKLYYLIVSGFLMFFVLVKLNLLVITPFVFLVFGTILGAVLTHFINKYINKRIEREP